MRVRVRVRGRGRGRVSSARADAARDPTLLTLVLALLT